MHIVFLNPQGNFDKKDSYWTMHPDFGGQLVYVKEIACSMASLGHKIDIITRRFDDPNFPEFKDEIDGYEGFDNLRIIRIPCGPNKFLNKELLWEHLNEWTDNIIHFYDNEKTMFDFMTGHYGDGGLACAILKSKLNIGFSFTGHSLGAQKLDKLGATLNNIEQLDQKYQFTKRIMAERFAIQYSDLIFVSTSQEKTEQYTHPLYLSTTNNSNPLKFIITPPGANTKVFAPYSGNNVEEEMIIRIENIIQRDISEKRRELPFIISASRLDPKKNHLGLVKAYANNEELQSQANLLISVRGIQNAFEDYSNSSLEEKNILDEVFQIIQDKNLFGKITFFSINSQSELADTYRYLTKRKSIFTLTALYEPFGLAPIEAMSTGLPAVVTKYGGPSEVLEENNEFFGVLVDAFDENDIASGLLKALNNYEYFKKQGMRRVVEKYTWLVTAKLYLNAIKETIAVKKNETVVIDDYFLNPEKTTIDVEIIKKQFR
ncbi:MAG: glycosyltransferase [Bacilli bacterium]|nr:glycosyltransferase [Bacilli bacterium]